MELVRADCRVERRTMQWLQQNAGPTIGARPGQCSSKACFGARFRSCDSGYHNHQLVEANC